LFNALPSLRILLFFIIGFFLRDYFTFWLLIPLALAAVLVLLINRYYLFLLIYTTAIVGVGVFKSESLSLPENVYRINKVLINSELNFKFITTTFPKKIFEIEKSKYQEGNLFEGDLIFWSKGFDSVPIPIKLEGFIYADYLNDIGVDGVVKLKNFPTKVGVERWSVFRFATKFKNIIIDELLNVTQLSKNSKGMLIALLTGDRSFLNRSVKNTFREAGVIHVLAISGMHVGVFYLLLVFIFKKTFHLKAKTALLFIGGSIVFYAFLSGLSPSVIRATIMLLLIQIGTIINSKVNTLNLVFTACWMMLVYEPIWIYDIGFQLSFSAVIGIIVFLNCFKKLSFKGSLRVFSDLLKVSFGAFLFTAPILSYHFNIVNLTSLWASLIIVPFISILMYGGILGLFSLIIIQLKNFVFLGLNYFIKVIENLVFILLDYSNISFYFKCTFSELLFYYMFLFSVLFSKKHIFYISGILLIISAFFKPSEEVKLLNCKKHIEIKVENKCYKLKRGDLLQRDKYFFSINKFDEKEFTILLYNGYNGFLDKHLLIDSIIVDNYHKLKLNY
jgi:ComEC/Rec2-related protein